ncbi:MAG: phosphodiester glycosidase family protein [Saprospiraceae bacterium]|nr:phosphodiester glycosidase family protein [Saprospiraceae bacterium]
MILIKVACENRHWRRPVLIQDGEIHITNREERMFVESADVKHPRAAMGYTSDHHLIILSIEGRHPGIADGVSLMQEAQILKDLGCVEALNLDGGGQKLYAHPWSRDDHPFRCYGQRPVPAVFFM